ncbi:MAG TPA: amidohydrolase family protein [Victivallales bacterium]|nr:amidohydrolase family protein [Victivallales bacterium]
MLLIDSHAHGMDAKLNAQGKPTPPIIPIWEPGKMTPEEYVKSQKEIGIESILILDPPDVTFYLKKLFGDFVIPAPQVDLDATNPEAIDKLFQQGAIGIKFISPEKSYGHDSYFPIYDAVRENNGLAVFHTGFLTLMHFEPGGIFGRRTYTDITDMRPAALDRVARAFPDLKILMAHFGNPWWEEAWKICASHNNIYADLSGGTCVTRSMDMWAETFAPNGIIHKGGLERLCFGTDSGYFVPGNGDDSRKKKIDFHVRLLDRINAPEEIRQKIWRENILAITKKNS